MIIVKYLNNVKQFQFSYEPTWISNSAILLSNSSNCMSRAVFSPLKAVTYYWIREFSAF